MGFIRRLFGAKKSAQPRPEKDKRRWSFARSSDATPSKSKRGIPPVSCGDDNLDANKHAIAVAAATAAVAEAALAAAHAAAEVVRLTSAGGGGVGGQRRFAQEMAAVKIQSAFRGYLARRALRALKALVKLQALVRGHIMRKHTADMLRRMQTLVRLQARARANRGYVPPSFNTNCKLTHSRSTVPASPDKDKCQFRAYSTKFDGPSILKRCGSNSNIRDIVDLDKERLGSNWLDRWMEESLCNNQKNASLRHGHGDDERSDKILEVDTWKPRLISQQSSRTFRTSQHGLASECNNYSFMAFDSPRKLSSKASSPVPNVSSGEGLPFSSLKNPGGHDESVLRTAENSPQVFSASSRPGSSSARRSPFTPTRSECSWGYFNSYTGHPNYMANTESSRAKFRSQSAPRQRLEFDRYGSAKRSLPGFYGAGTNSERDFDQHVDYRHRAYPASGPMYRHGSANQI